MNKHLGLVILIPLLVSAPARADVPTSQSLLDSLKAHQDKVKTIEADFSLSIFGVGDLTIKQKGQYTYNAPNQVVMEFTEPSHNTVKINGGEVLVSINGGPFSPVQQGETTAGMNSDIYYYHFIKQFYLVIDEKNQPAQSGLVKIIGYRKDAEGNIADEKTVRNVKALEVLFEKDRGLVTQIDFIGFESIPPMQLKMTYENKSGLWVPKKIFARIITPGGDIASGIVMENRKVERN